MPARRPQKNVTPLPRWARIALPLLWRGILAFCVLHRELFTLEGIPRIRQGNRLLTASLRAFHRLRRRANEKENAGGR